MSQKTNITKVLKASSTTFDDTIKMLPVVGKHARKSKFSPTLMLGGGLVIAMITGMLWPLIKLLVLGGIGFHTWFLNKNTKNNKTLKTGIIAGLVGAFFMF